MGPFIKEENDQLICVKDGHDEPVILILENNEIPFKERFFCSLCLEKNPHPGSSFSIGQAIERLKEKLEMRKSHLYQRKKTYSKQIKEFQEKLRLFQTKLNQVFDETQRVATNWTKEIENFRESDSMSLIKNLKVFLQSNDIIKNDAEEINKQSIRNAQKIESIFQQLGDQCDFNNCYDALKDIINSLNEQHNQQTKNSQINYVQHQMNKEDYVNCQQNQLNKIQLINTIKRKTYSRAIAFNKSGTTMISGCDDDIKIWKFYKGEIFKQQRLKGHNDWILCFAFSQKFQWFASGSQDCTIRCWKDKSNNDWISSKPKQQHQDYVMCLLLNKDEDQLISCSLDHSIKVWKVDVQTNELDIYYNLEDKHTDSVYCICLNDSETSLVSCSQDKTIILWNKDYDQKWVYQHHIITDDYGFRINFVEDNYLVWLQHSKGLADIIEVNSGRLLNRPELQIQLNEQSSDDNYLFPPIVNKQKQVILLKHNKFIYILKKSYENGKFQVILKPIECNNQSNFGALTLNGEYLIVINSGINEYRIYNINYDK